MIEKLGLILAFCEKWDLQFKSNLVKSLQERMVFVFMEAVAICATCMMIRASR